MRIVRKFISARYPLIAAVLLAVFIVTCRGLVAGYMGSTRAHHDAPQAAHASCCSVEDAGTAAILHSQMQSALPSVYILFFALALVVSFLSARVLTASASPPYGGTLERRYGGTRLFCKYADLFSAGILHPKRF